MAESTPPPGARLTFASLSLLARRAPKRVTEREAKGGPRLAASIPGAQLSTDEGEGHMVAVSHRVDIVRDLLGRAPGRLDLVPDGDRGQPVP